MTDRRENLNQVSAQRWIYYLWIKQTKQCEDKFPELMLTLHLCKPPSTSEVTGEGVKCAE